MNPIEIRSELLRQHRRLHGLMAATRACAKQWRAGLPMASDLRASLAELSTQLCLHHLEEEALLRDLLVNGHVSGADDAATLCEAHVQEHARLSAALKAIDSTPTELAGVGVVALVDWIGQHMDREEAVFLAEDVFLDDTVVRPPSEG
jgi:hypothetical protein